MPEKEMKDDKALDEEGATTGHSKTAHVIATSVESWCTGYDVILTATCLQDFLKKTKEIRLIVGKAGEKD